MLVHRFAGVLVFVALLTAGCGDDTGDAEPSDLADAVVDTDDTPADDTPADDAPGDESSEDAGSDDTAAEGDDAGELAFDDPAAYYLVENLTPELGGAPQIIEGAIVLGTQDAYVVDYTNCCTDDTLYADISSVEDNAVFSIYGPAGAVLATESTSENFILEQGGEFWIVVGSTRGNATYTIEIGLSQNAS